MSTFTFSFVLFLSFARFYQASESAALIDEKKEEEKETETVAENLERKEEGNKNRQNLYSFLPFSDFKPKLKIIVFPFCVLLYFKIKLCLKQWHLHKLNCLLVPIN